MRTKEETANILKRELCNRVTSVDYISPFDFRMYELSDGYEIKVRGLGFWEGADGEIDYDCGRLSDRSKDEIKYVIEKVSEISGRKISYSPRVKNWIIFAIE